MNGRLLPSIRRDRARNKLKKLLAISNDAAFFRMIWAIDQLQNGDPEVAVKHLQHPPEAVGADITSRYRVHSWTMETLVNELLITGKQGPLMRLPSRTLNCSSFNAAVAVINALHHWEDAEAGVWLRDHNIKLEMHRIAQRQFEWQRGFFNLPQFYRSAFLFNFPAADTLFQVRYGVPIADFVRCGVAVSLFFAREPFMALKADLSWAEVTPEVRDATLNLVTLRHNDARTIASALRAPPGHVAYKPSVLRQHPGVVFDGDGAGLACAPLWELMIQRVTSGVYYDLQGADGSIRNEIARRFEAYSEALIRGFLPDIEITPEVSYNNDRNRTPDLLLGTGGSLFAAVECKATKMSVQAKFSDRPLDEAQRGYDEMVKAVFQVWRFFSHQRRGIGPSISPVAPEAVGLILTLDGWLTMFGSMRSEIIQRARSHAARTDAQMLEEDMRPIVFCPIDDFESTLSRASVGTFVAALRAAATPEYIGYHLSSVHRELQPDEPPQKPYPFKNQLTEVLPWWGFWNSTKAMVGR